MSNDSLFDDFDDDLDAENMMIGLSANLAAAVGGKAAVLHEGDADEGMITWKPPKEAGLHNSQAVVAGGGKHWYNEEDDDEEEPLDPSVLVTFDNVNVDSDNDEDGGDGQASEEGAAAAGPGGGASVSTGFSVPVVPMKPQLIKADSADSLFEDEPLPVGNIEANVSGNIAEDAYKDTIEDDPLQTWEAPNTYGPQNSIKVSDALEHGTNWDVVDPVA